MAALPTDAPVSASDRPTALRFAPPVAEPAPPFAWPKNDRLPLQKKIARLSDRGLWPKLEALAKRHGWHAEEVCRFIDANLPSAPCPICGTRFYTYSRRVKYCSDKCRRRAAEGAERRHTPDAACQERYLPPSWQPPAPKPEPTPDDLCIWLVKDTGRYDERFYLLLVARDLFGEVALVRQWGLRDSEHTQRVVTYYETLDAALDWLGRYRAQQEKRGYRRATLGAGKGDLLRHAYEAAGMGARP